MGYELMKHLLKKLLSKNKNIKKIAVDLKNNIQLDTNIPEITPINARRSLVFDKEQRLNLILPSINREHIFGGISTAIKIFDEITSRKNISKRIIVTDASPSKNDMENFSEYFFAKPEEDLENDIQIVIFNDRYNKTIPVSKNDFFMTTGWWTEYITNDILIWQQKEYDLSDINKSIYLVQDYEPGFYEWSTRYLLSKSTYTPINKKIGIFNTRFLYDYFKKNGHSFAEEYVFEPTLNENLLRILEEKKKSVEIKKEKILLIYGRPSVKRNAFELIVEALKLVAISGIDLSDWRFVSLGEKHQDIELGNGNKLISYGKVSLEEYADFMWRAYIGVSLMVSPHPSYPPLEMAAFGMKVITNIFEDRDLSKTYENIVTVQNISIKKLADKILEEISTYEQKKIASIRIVEDSIENSFGFIKRMEL